jgi:soluble lytic murein transglycosylase-like protein
MSAIATPHRAPRHTRREETPGAPYPIARAASAGLAALPLPVVFLVPVIVVTLLLLWVATNVSAGAPDLGVGILAAAPAGAGEVKAPEAAPPAPVIAATPGSTSLSPVFTPEVRYWEDDIIAWATRYSLDPNVVATIMQIESCGNPSAVSPSGAQGLFQVMPFHFAAGEDMLDPETNATRGLNFLTEMLAQSEGHVGIALVGYNGGYRAVQGNWDTWAPETRRYYRWGAGLYMDAITGLVDSPTLHDWLDAGGASLCAGAHQVLQMP